MTHVTVRASLLGVVLVAFASPALSQPVREGDRVRVTAPSVASDPQAGQLLALSPTALLLQVEVGQPRRPGSEPSELEIPRSAISLLEVSEGRSGNAGKGALIGAGVGLALGLIVIGSDYDGLCQGSGDYGQFCVALVGLSTLAGGGLGLVIGAASRTEHWRPVALDGP